MDARYEGQVSTTIETDVCIAGGGPAGLVLAHALATAGVDVVLLESGADSCVAADPLDQGEVTGQGFDNLTSSRQRGVGGASLLWNTRLQRQPAARYLALEPIDFEPRPWVAHAGWPVGLGALAPYYRQAEALAGLTSAPPPSPAVPAVAGPIAPAWYRVGLASVFTHVLPGSLANHTRARLRRDATVTRIGLASDRSRVLSYEWTSRNGERGEVRAMRYVLALGAIENARHLLLNGVDGNWVGRGFMEHPRDWSLRLTHPTRALAQAESFFAIEPEGPGRARWGRLALTESTMRSERLLGGSATLYPLPGERIDMRTPVRWLLGRPRARAYGVTINLEQAPDRENRVTLSDRRDGFGLQLPRLVWRWTAADEASRGRVRALMRQALEAAGLGRVEESEQVHPDPNAHHHAGTTRMSQEPGDGVVDQDCQVHGTDNLFVAGGSVFPTAGFANPTLTIVALALRLADHLRR